MDEDEDDYEGSVDYSSGSDAEAVLDEFFSDLEQKPVPVPEDLHAYTVPDPQEAAKSDIGEHEKVSGRTMDDKMKKKEVTRRHSLCNSGLSSDNDNWMLPTPKEPMSS